MFRRIFSSLLFTLLIILNINIYGAQFTNIQDISPGVNHSSIVLGDIDNDGDLDLVMTGASNVVYFRVYKNNGNGNYTFFQDISPGVCHSSIALGDIDNDGDLDLVMTGASNGNYFKVYKNNGNGSFTFFENLSPGVYNSSIALGDIDNDGDLDLVMTGGPDSTTCYFKVYKNNSNGNFTFFEDINPKNYYGSIAFGDIDNDGDLDLVMTGSGSSGVYYSKVYKNNGSGNFSYFEDISQSVGNGSSISFGDIDNDSDLDLVMTGFGAGDTKNFKVYKNNGIGNFSFFQDISPGVIYSSIALGDIDNDGDLDLVMTGSGGVSGVYYFKVYKNNGSGSFSFFEDINPRGYHSSILLGDIDSDGDLDLIMTGWESDTSTCLFKIYKNNETIINNLPSIPEGLISESSNGHWRFKWNSSIDDHTSTNMLRYNICIGTNTSSVYDYISTNIMYPRGQANLGSVLFSTNYQSAIPDYKKCWVKICAIDSAFKNSDYSSELEITNITTYLSSPTRVQFIVIDYNTIKLTWNDNSDNESGFKIYRSIDNLNFVLISIIGVDLTSYIDSGLEINKTYWYYVVAFNSYGESIPSNVVSGKILKEPYSISKNVLKNENDTIKFNYNYPQANEIKIQIYTIDGLLVKSYDIKNKLGNITWDGKNDNNEKVVNGMYLLQVIVNGKANVYKIVVMK